MKIVLVLGRYLPAKSGGIENYSHFLANLLLKNNHAVDVAIINNENMEPYTFDKVNVIPLKKGFESFALLLKDGAYDICHFQELSAFGGIEIFWFKEARRYCRKIFFTFHLPYLTCYKNDFRYLGVEDCNKFSSPDRCVSCIIATKLHYKKRHGFNLYNFGIDVIIPLIKKTPKIKRVKSNIQSGKNDFEELIETCDTIFIYGAWFKKLLIKNGYLSPKIKLIPHITKVEITRKEKEDRIKRKVLFVGRIEKAKGLHLLVRAMNLISTQYIQLDVVGNVIDEKYFESCKEEYFFNYKGTLPRTKLLQSFPEYDFLILPSVFTEMYSLVLREAFFENLPVIVSSAKGNKDVVTEGKNGFIFEYDNANDLTTKIDKAYQYLSEGWQPEFSQENNTEKDNQEIVSYYQ